MTAGAALSKPTTSSMPASWGSAIEKPLDTMPTTTSLAAMPTRAGEEAHHLVGRLGRRRDQGHRG
jgi:hypothetical protein